MKVPRFWTLLVVSATTACLRPPPAAAPPKPATVAENPGHLVLHYTFDDCTAKDASGHGRNGVVRGAPACVDGPLGKALSFDGVRDYVAIPRIRRDPLAAELTVTGWVKARGFGGPGLRWVTILNIGNTGMDAPFAVVYAVDGEGRFLPFVRLMSVTGQSEMKIVQRPAGVEGKWLFFAWTYNRGILKVYEDGALSSSLDTGITQLDSTSRPMDVGRDVPGATEYLKGVLDDFRIYDYELPAEEIRRLSSLGVRR